MTTAHVAPSGELNHATEVVGLVALWLLSRTPAAAPAGPVRPARAADRMSPGGRSRRRFGRLGALVALSFGFVVLFATPAFAHATLLQTTPSAGQVLTTSPKTIQLRFNESVEVDAGSVRVFDSKGNRVDTGGPSTSGQTVTVPVREKLADGSYVVTWRVVSADSHPVQGTFRVPGRDERQRDEPAGERPEGQAARRGDQRPRGRRALRRGPRRPLRGHRAAHRRRRVRHAGLAGVRRVAPYGAHHRDRLGRRRRRDGRRRPPAGALRGRASAGRRVQVGRVPRLPGLALRASGDPPAGVAAARHPGAPHAVPPGRDRRAAARAGGHPPRWCSRSGSC